MGAAYAYRVGIHRQGEVAAMPDAKQPEDAYEAPKVEQIETEDQPAVTAAGSSSGTTTVTTTVD
jgi:hypothetical protein